MRTVCVGNRSLLCRMPSEDFCIIAIQRCGFICRPLRRRTSKQAGRPIVQLVWPDWISLTGACEFGSSWGADTASCRHCKEQGFGEKCVMPLTSQTCTGNFSLCSCGRIHVWSLDASSCEIKSVVFMSSVALSHTVPGLRTNCDAKMLA